MSKFSDFIRNATPDEKAVVYEKVMERATRTQKGVDMNTKQQTHFADDATLKRLAELEQINADLLAALEALLHARIIYDGGGNEKSIDDARQDITEPLAIQARAAIAKAGNVANSHHLSAINVDGEQK